MAKRIFWVAVGILIGAAGYALAQQAAKENHTGLKQRVLLEQVLPEKIDG